MSQEQPPIPRTALTITQFFFAMTPTKIGKCAKDITKMAGLRVERNLFQISKNDSCFIAVFH
jgi:hypothetical protein